MDRDALASWLKAHMNETGLNQSQLAGRIKTTSQAVGKWVRGDIDTLSPSSIRKLAGYKGQSAVDICDWLDVPAPNEFLEQMNQRDLLDRVKTVESEIKSLKELLSNLTKFIHNKLLFPILFC